jgi:hypothetical protein
MEYGNGGVKGKVMRSLQNAPFSSISVSGSNFNPQNTKCIPLVNPPKIGGGLKLSR